MCGHRRLRFAPALTLAALFVALATYAVLAAATTRLRIGGQATYVHNIPLYDAEGQIIDPAISERPVSLTVTCGKCHDVDDIHQGTHFAGGWSEQERRPLEPWLLTDAGINLSTTVRPDELDYTAWRAIHGSHSPGAVVPESRLLDGRARFGGSLEVDCFVCHLAPERYDFTERSRQIGRGNLRWAITAASGLGTVTGEINSLPRTYSAERDEFGETPGVPSIAWSRQRFESGNRVLLPLARTVSNQNCYLCHSHETVGASAAPALRHRDIHVVRGMSCTDCHSHEDGVGHHLIRGDLHSSGVLSCAGCHLGTEDAPGGSHGAPVPLHAGLPPLHLERLTCTACHSGPTPGTHTPLVQTSRAHQLGLPSDHRTADLWPHILGNVFLRNSDGMIEPSFATWTSGFFRLDPARATDATPSGTLTPIPSPEVRASLRSLGVAERTATETFSDTELHRILSHLNAQKPDSPAVFELAGQRQQLDTAGALAKSPSPVPPLAWPMGHAVRPARESLGARGCIECHSPAGAMDFSLSQALLSTAATALPTTPVLTQLQLRAEPALPATLLNLTFTFRTAFKWGLCALLVAGFIRLRTAPAQSVSSLPAPGTGRPLARLVAFLLLISCLGSLTTALPALLGFGTLTYLWLLLHFAFGSAACVLFVVMSWIQPTGLLARLTLIGALLTVATVLITMTPLLSSDHVALSLFLHRIASLATLVFAAAWAWTTLRANQSPAKLLP